jgi:hypothetical protein
VKRSGEKCQELVRTHTTISVVPSLEAPPEQFRCSPPTYVFEEATPINQEIQSQPASPVSPTASEELPELAVSEDQSRPKSNRSLYSDEATSKAAQENHAPLVQPQYPVYEHGISNGLPSYHSSGRLPRGRRARPPRLILTPVHHVETAPVAHRSPDSTTGSETPRQSPCIAVEQKTFVRETRVIVPKTVQFDPPTRKEAASSHDHDASRTTPSPPYFSPQTPVAMLAEFPLILCNSPTLDSQKQELIIEDMWVAASHARGLAKLAPPRRPRARAQSDPAPPSAHPDSETLSMKGFLVSNPPDHHRATMETRPLTDIRQKGYIPSASSINGKQAIMQSYFHTTAR